MKNSTKFWIVIYIIVTIIFNILNYAFLDEISLTGGFFFTLAVMSDFVCVVNLVIFFIMKVVPKINAKLNSTPTSEEQELATHLTEYIKEGHTQEECIGFSAGFKKKQSL